MPTGTSAPFQNVPMPALDLRRLLAVAIASEGVQSGTDMQVTQRGAGANMSVDVAAGKAYVQDDHSGGDGYYFAQLAIVENAVITTADATNPRIDRVGIRIRDVYLGDAANDWTLQVLAGTPTAGATLTNLTGAAAIPGSWLLLANVLVAAGVTSIANAAIDTSTSVRRLLRHAPNPPSVRAYRTGVQGSIANLTWTSLNLDGHYWDTDGLHSTTGNNQRLTVPDAARAGKYLIIGTVAFDTAAGGVLRGARVLLNFATTLAQVHVPNNSGVQPFISLSTIWDMAAGDYVELQCYQDSGGLLNASFIDHVAPTLMMTRIG